ncbi:MAG TPA: hypothetical protein VD948_06300, partial [Rhodothermales bacterium]|nr:hypothetical protein [Rhodothermales bacterium]
PEDLDPDLDVIRTTASAQYGRTTSTGTWASTLVWGYNAGRGVADDHHSGHSVVLESDLTQGPLALFGRAEYVQKHGEELGVVAHELFGISSLTLGAAHRIARLSGVDAMLGATGTAYAVPEGLQEAYGEQPFSAQVFLRLVLDH